MIPRTSTLAFAATLACAPLAWGGTITGSVKIKGAAQPAVVYVEAAPGAVAVAATGMTTADEGRLFRFTIKHSIFLMVLMGLISMMFAYVFPSYVPTV